MVLAGVAILFAKIGGLSSPGYGPPRWQPWTWRPGPLFRSTLPTGGDMGAHVWGPDFVRNHLVSGRRLTGWSKDWYAGFPVLTFYFPLPTWTIVALTPLLGPHVAFKIVSVAGLLGMPFAAMLLARTGGLPRLDRYLFALGALVFVVDPHFDILGGNINSTMAGEFSFAISLALALVFLALVVRVLTVGRGRVPAALALAGTALSHLLPTFFAAGGALLMAAAHLVGQRPASWPSRRRQFLDLASIAVAGTLLIAFWVLPFAANLDYTADMGWERTTTFLGSLFPPMVHPMVSGAAVAGGVVVLGIIGGAVQLARFLRALIIGAVPDPRSRLGAVLALLAALSAAMFCATPQFRILNERALPFYFLCLSLLAGQGLVALAHLLRNVRRRLRPTGVASGRPWSAIGLALTALLVWWGPGSVFDVLPGITPIPKLDNRGISVQRADSTDDAGASSDWANYNYNGYQALGPDWTEYKRVMDVMRDVGREHGCGRALWDYEDELDRYGTSMGMMLLPYWTNGCIGSMEGLYFESSASVPYHFLNASLLSARSSDPVRGVVYTGLNVVEGVRKLQQWGVRYYMAFAPAAQAQARANADLTLLATTPYQRECSAEETGAGTCPSTWEIYQVRGSELVAGLGYEPAVLTGIGQSQNGGWLDVAMRQYTEPSTFPVPFAADGPSPWQRVEARSFRAPAQVPFGAKTTIGTAVERPLPTVGVSEIVETDSQVSFRVDRVGVPVVVKVSYFPNWRVRGADGPYRLAPNLMVVVPTSTRVVLRFTRGGPEMAGLALSALGVLAVVTLWTLDRRRRQSREPAAR